MARRTALSALLLLTLFNSSVATAEQLLEIKKGLSVYGSNELPKGLTIVPWQIQDPDTAVDKMSFSVAEEVFRPIDRNVFRRQLGYYHELFTTDGPPR